MALALYSDGTTIERSAADAAHRQSSVPVSQQERSGEGFFILPGGYVDDSGISHYDVELTPVTGNEEEFLSNLPPNASSAHVVTGLLARCVKRIGSLPEINSSLVRDLLVGDRDYLILKLYEMTFGQKVDVILRCPSSACGKPMELPLFLDQLPVERKRVAQRFFAMQLSSVAGNGLEQRHIEFRLPTGADQEAIAAMVNGNDATAIHHLLARCIRRIGEPSNIDAALITKLPAGASEEIEEKMQQLAPEVEIELEAVCPECQNPFVVPFDFAGFFFAEMRNRLSILEREVHFLAWHYHWAEKDILAMTRTKRRRYVALLWEEIERFNQH